MIKIRIANVEKYWDLGKGKSFSIDLAPGYTCLIGPNGTGKSTMLTQIRDTLMRERDTESNQLLYKVLHYDNQHDGGSKNFGMWMMQGQFQKIAEVTSSSEGEGIIFNLGEFAAKCGQSTRDCIEQNRKLIILIVTHSIPIKQGFLKKIGRAFCPAFLIISLMLASWVWSFLLPFL